MNRLLTTSLLLFIMVLAHGQDITKHEADPLLQFLCKTKPGANRIHLLLQSEEFQIFKAGENKADLDSAATFINEAKLINTGIESDEVYGYMSLLEARLSKEKRQEPEAGGMLEKAIQIVSKGKDKFHLGKAYFELCQCYDYNDPRQIIEKIRLAKLSVQAFQQSGDIEQQLFSHKFLADLYNINDEFDEALKEIKLSQEVYKSINFTELQGVYDLLGYILLAQKHYKQGQTYELLALQTAENVPDTSMQLCEINNHFGLTYMWLVEPAKAIENDALKAIETSQHRIYAMSLIHQKLYQSEDVKAIDMAVYVPEFTEYLKDSFGIINQIQFQLHIEPLELGISQAIPIALIINEAVTNSIKYAFTDNKAGIIKINMFQVEKQIQLTIANNGIGINTSIANNSSTGSLGQELMRGLSEDINARIKFENDHGTKIMMIFNVDKFNKSATSPKVREKQTYA